MLVCALHLHPSATKNVAMQLCTQYTWTCYVCAVTSEHIPKIRAVLATSGQTLDLTLCCQNVRAYRILCKDQIAITEVCNDDTAQAKNDINRCDVLQQKPSRKIARKEYWPYLVLWHTCFTYLVIFIQDISRDRLVNNFEKYIGFISTSLVVISCFSCSLFLSFPCIIGKATHLSGTNLAI